MSPNYGIMTKKAGETMQSILLVEDDKHIVDNLTEYLEGEGFRVGCASGQAAALERLGRVEVDTVRGTATKDGRDLNLSALEYRLLLMFLNHPGAVLTRSQLLEGIWDIAGDFVNDNTLTVYIKRLREKIEDDPQAPALIKTVRGLGYKAEMR